jgi:hypothetical protein
MRCQWLWVGAVLWGALMLSGCAESKAYRSYTEEVDSWSYPYRFAVVWKDWALDLADVVNFDVGAGETIGLDVQPTELFQAGFLFGDVMKFGWRDRGLGFYREIHKEGGASWVYYRDMRFEPIMGTASLFERPRMFRGFPIRFNDEWHWMDVRAEAGLIFGSVHAGVSPKQALDFAISTLLLPVNLFIRPALDKAGMHIPDVDIDDDDTAAQLRRKYNLQLIKNPEVFEPTEEINDLIKLPY